jgi:mRNA interferase RelE/StbE
MACYKIAWKGSANKELKRLDKTVITRILQAVESLSENPYPSGCRKIVGSQFTYRIRVGDYRVIYDPFRS